MSAVLRWHDPGQAHLCRCQLFLRLSWIWIAALLQKTAKLLRDRLEIAHLEYGLRGCRGGSHNRY